MPPKLNVVVFSGAGMSAESGIQTFRDSDGLWEEYSIEEVATPNAWKSNPELVTAFYNERRKRILEAEPNEAHLQIAALQKVAKVNVVTQNIDDLHERAGSKNVLHLHGNIRLAKSSGPNPDREYFEIDGWKLTSENKCPDGYRLRPHVVWFGEAVPAYDDAASILSQADVLIVIGTSLQVYPAAGLIHYANKASEKYLIDPKANALSIPADFIKVACNASEGINRILEKLISKI